MGRLRSRAGFTLLELMIIVAILGILASIAIPAFQKYIRRSRAMEGIRAVRQIFDASVAYYADEHTDRTGVIVAKQFPASTGPTPTTTCCDLPGAKCQPDSTVFETNPTWSALNFTIADPHFYVYTYEAAGTDEVSQFTARANGDLNCNTLWSTFERVGIIDGGEYVAGTALYKNLALE
jgi:prepilin-type N-terminal cleavage/methylation domain-containing protein